MEWLHPRKWGYKWTLMGILDKQFKIDICTTIVRS